MFYEYVQPSPQVPREKQILLEKPFADSEIGTPSLCLTKLRVMVGGKINLS